MPPMSARMAAPLAAAPAPHLALQWLALARSRGARYAAAAEAADAAAAPPPVPWRWEAGDGSAGTLPNDWMARLNAAVGGRWAADTPPAAAPSTQLVLYGQRMGYSVFAEGQVWLCNGQGRCERATGDAQALEALRPALR